MYEKLPVGINAYQYTSSRLIGLKKAIIHEIKYLRYRSAVSASR